ncbi:MAG: hypothetical protein ABJD53_01875 [Gammaproteobacteria bacterium]
MTKHLLPLLLGTLATVLVAEAALRALPVSTGYDLRAVDPSNPVLRGTSHFRYTYSRGWNLQLSNSGELNNYGFRASYDYVRDPRALVVIGNSFVQADALDPRDDMAERLGRRLGRPSYGIGSDGASLADYLADARWATGEFGTHTLLILLTTGDLKHACEPRPGQHFLNGAAALSLALVERPVPSTFKRLLNDSRLFRYVFDNLRFAANWDKGWRRNQDQPPDLQTAAAFDAGCGDHPDAGPATQFLMREFHALEGARDARVIFVLAPGYRREQGVEAGGQRDVDQFADRAEQSGFAVVRLTEAFDAALATGTRLDFMPIDGHWNAAANALAADVVAGAVSAFLR